MARTVALRLLQTAEFVAYRIDRATGPLTDSQP